MHLETLCLGLHVGHDRGISISKGGKIIFHVAVERIDRKKYSDSPALPIVELATVLDWLSIDISEIQATCVTYHSVRPERIAATLEAEFKAAFPNYDGIFSALDHHLAHALGAFACSPFDEATVIVADGAGDCRAWGTQAESVYHVTRDHFYLLEDRVQDRPLSHVNRPEFFDVNFFGDRDRTREISLGLKYEQITYLCGFQPGQAGQTMALAGYGTPLFDVTSLVPQNLRFSLTYVDILEKFYQHATAEGRTLREFARIRRADIAATMQLYLQKALANIVDSVVASYNPHNLCFSGGVFLNCTTNRAIFDRHRDRGLFFLSACNDEGQSLGAVSYAHWLLSSKIPLVSAEFPYLGFQYTQGDCESALSLAGLSYRTFDDEQLAAEVARLIAAGSIVGVLRGRSETGPRALGHRSILADPRSPTVKERLDKGIKRRAQFRPYAPVILDTAIQDYCDLDTASPYMLMTATLKHSIAKQIPAVAHVDHTVRLQSVSVHDEPFLHLLLNEFATRTGIPLLLNTSFNDECEPIVETPADAIRIFTTTDIDALVLENTLHVRQEP